jgi:excisionase family DNA binding protein
MPNFDLPLQITVSVAEPNIAELVRLFSAIVGALRGAEPTLKSAKERSQHGIFAGKKPPEDVELLVDTNQVAKLLQVSPRTVWKMQDTGEMPKPIRIGRAVRWGFEEIKAWVDARCPKATQWEKLPRR